jgi:hypothetical protein
MSLNDVYIKKDTEKLIKKLLKSVHIDKQPTEKINNINAENIID